MKSSTLEKLFDETKKHDIPARVVAVRDNLVWVRFFLESDVDIVSEISRDKDRNCFLRNFQPYDLSEGDTLLVECEGLILNYFLEKGTMPNSKNNCSCKKKLNKKEYNNRVNELKIKKIFRLSEKLNELETQLTELKKEKKEKLDEMEFIDTFGQLVDKGQELIKEQSQLEAEIKTKKNSLQKLQKENEVQETKKNLLENKISDFEKIQDNLTNMQEKQQKLEKNLQHLKSDVQEYQWVESVKHHLTVKNNQADYSQENLTKIIPQIKSIQNELTNKLGLNTDFANCYLFSLLTALLNGRFLLLTGHIGTGKSHLIKQSGTLFGGKTDMVAVRPAWLDSSDLLGYFDPLNSKYHATDFVRYLSKENNNRLHMILLDEMNIARIENYGADILANLSPIFNNQRQEKSNQIKLYPTDMQEMLFLHKLYHESKDGLSTEQQNEFKLLLQQYQAKSSISIEDNVLICGTLNIDGSTENLSPKMIDRSLILKFPDFDGQFGILQKTEEIEFPINALKNHIEKIKPDIKKWQKFYDEQLKDMQELLLPISHRVAEDYLLFQQINDYFAITEDNEILNQYFFYSRIVPRLRIEKINDERKNRLENKLQGDLFKVFLQEIKNSENGEFIDYQHICG